MSNPMIDAAKAYQARGWRVVQLHGVTDEGFCTCRLHKDCRSAGKHPVNTGWESAEPMTDEEIEAAWSGWRAGHNIGIASGRASGWFVLDVDPNNGGFESIARLQEDHETLPATVAQQTGSGGYHLLWAMPEDFEPTNRRGGLKEYPGLDIRGTGGQIVAAPSVSSKGAYAWQSEPGTEPEPAPAWLLDLLRPVEREETALDGPVVEDEQRLDAYTTRVREAEVGRLTKMAEAAGPGYQGEPWNQTTYDVACNLIELANSDWNDYTPKQAAADVWKHAPRDDGFTDEDVRVRLKSAADKVGSHARPQPVERESEIASWASEPGVRVDPRLLPKSDESPVRKEDAAWPVRERNDLGNAMRFVDHFRGVVRWVPEAKQWAVYRAGRWSLTESPEIQGLIQRMFAELIPRTEALEYSDTRGEDDDPSDREQFLKWLQAQKMQGRMEAAERAARGRHELRASVADFDAKPLLLNVLNGTIDLATGELLPHDSSRLLMKQAPVEYDPDAKAPLWQAFLDRVMPDESMQAYLQRWSGYSCTGDTREQAFACHHGDGANGKSVWISVLSAILGDYGRVIPPSTLLAGQHEEHPTGVAGMHGRRFLPATETAPGKRLDEEKVKNLTGGEPVAARFMGKDFFEFTPTGKIHLVTNHLPVLSDAKSIWRRIHLIKWAVSIPEAQQDRMLEQKLKEAELPGILAWLVRGAKDWLQQGLAMPAAAKADLDAYKTDSDPFGDFLTERTMPAPGSQTPTGVLYQAYQAWAFAQGIRKPMQQQAFSAKMAERGFKRYRTPRSRGFTDIIPVAPVTEALPWEVNAS